MTGAPLLPHADVLIVNETEALELLGEELGGDWPAVSERLRLLGPNLVVVTLGRDGAVASIDGRVIQASAPGVTVVDTTGPQIEVPLSFAVEATGPDGAPAEYAVKSNDAVDGERDATCVPASGSVFPINAPGPTTTITCSAIDAHDNAGEPRTFTVAVHDTTPPVFDAATISPDLVEEATSPAGASVAFALPSANDLVDLDKANAEFPPFPEFKVNAGAVHTAFFFSNPGSVYWATKSGTWGDARNSSAEMGERYLEASVKSTIAVLEKNLDLIDRAIAESRAALERDPASEFLADQLARAMTKKVAILRTVALLPARS